MVLSNKRLKQKLRATLAESLTAKEAKKLPKDAAKVAVNSNFQSLKELLSSETQKPRLSKREKRRNNLPFEDLKAVQGSSDKEKENKEIDLVSLNDKKKKKRKRNDEVDEKKGNDADESAEKKQKKSKNKEKKKKKNKKKKGTESQNGESKVEGVVELVKIEESQENLDASTKVYVGGIPYYSTEDDIRSFFESCGTITEIDCMRFPESGKFRGIAMITFKTEAAAKRALALDGADMGGLFLKIQPYKTNRTQKSSDFAPEIVEGYNRIYVGNLSWDITEDDLRKLFSDCTISSIRFGNDKATGEFRGFAHVDFSDELSLSMALTLDQRVVCERPVRIRCAVPKKGTETRLNSESTSKNQNDTSSGNGKKKRRTCYECGVPGHLSSSCPQKRVKVGNSGAGG
ncbi:phragmoplastin interacting protein 1 [Tasmannia lanceolata]|uniref:phragmoplastin interacting protein 1 n=1 Tax=Tasmannia lanceolata TaxID=3420 RepID=UPI004064079B